MVDPSILIVIFGFYGEIFNNTKIKATICSFFSISIYTYILLLAIVQKS